MMSKYKLEKVSEYGDHDYLGHDGCNYDSPEDYVWIAVLGGCGCGYADRYGELAIELLRYFNTPHMERDREFWQKDEFETELMAHWLDNKDLLEHGTSIGGSWLSESGKQLLDVIESSRPKQSQSIE